MSKKKKIFITVLLAFLILTGTIVFYSHLFDINKYKGYIISAMEDVLKTDVSIDEIRLFVLNGVKINLKNVVIGREIDKNEHLSIERVTISIQILPLIFKKVIIKEIIFIRPAVNINIAADGKIKFFPVFKKSIKKGDTFFPLIKNIRVEGGDISFTDEFTAHAPFVIHFKDCNFAVKKPFLRKFFHFGVSCSLSDSKPLTTVDIKGKLTDFFINDRLDFNNISIEGDIKITSLDVDRFWGHYKAYIPYMPFSKIGSMIDMDIHYSGSMSGNLESSGKIILSKSGFIERQAYVAPDRFYRAIVYYEMTADKDSVDFEKLEVDLGKAVIQSKLSLRRVSYNNILTQLKLETSSFDIEEMKKILPFEILPENISSLIKDNTIIGNIKIGPLDFIGTLNQLSKLYLPENFSSLKGKIELNNISVKAAKGRLPVKDLNSALFFKRGGIVFSKTSLIYGNSRLNDLHGRISNIYTSPHIRLILKGKLDNRQMMDLFRSDFISQDIRPIVKSIKVISGLAEINMELSGYIKDYDSFGIKGFISFIKLGMKYKDMDIPVSNIEGRIEFNEDIIELSNLKGYVGKSLVSFSGKVDSYKSEKPVLLFKIHSKINGNDINKTLIKGMHMRFDGNVDFSLLAKGRLNRISITNSIDITDASYTYSTWISKPAGVMNKVYIEAGIDDFDDIVLKRINISLNSRDMVNIKGSFSLQNPGFNFKIDASELHLNYIKDIFPFFDHKNTSSNADLKVDLEIKKRIHSKNGLEIYGYIDLKSSNIRFKETAPLLERFNGIVHFDKESVYIDSAAIRIGESYIKINGRIENIERPEVSFNIHSPVLNVNEIVSLLPERKSRPKMTGSITIGKGRYKQFNFEDLSADVAAEKKDILKINNMKFKAFDGNFNIKGWLDATSGNGANFKFEANAEKIIIQKFFEKFLPSYSKKLSGKFAFAATFSNKKARLNDISSKLDGQVDFSLTDGFIDKTEFLKIKMNPAKSKADSEKDKTDDGKNKLHCDEISARFTINNGIASTDNFTLKVKDMKVMTAAGNIDIKNKLIDTKACIKTHPVIDSIVTKIPIVGKILTGRQESVVLKCFTIEGDINSPDVAEIPPKSFGKKLLEIFINTPKVPTEAVVPQ